MAAKDQKDAPKAEKKDATVIIKSDLDCKCCYKKVFKILCKLQEKEKIPMPTTSFDDKNKTVTITGPFDPQAVIQKIKCMACKFNVILDVQVKPDPPPPPPKTTPPPPPPPPKTPVCEGDKQLTVKVKPNISVGAAACCHHAQAAGHHHGGCSQSSSSSCGGAPAGCSCSTSSSSCGKKPECRCCSTAAHHHVCSCGKRPGGCSSGGLIAVCGPPPCKLLLEEQAPTCRIM